MIEDLLALMKLEGEAAEALVEDLDGIVSQRGKVCELASMSACLVGCVRTLNPGMAACMRACMCQ